MRDQQEEHFLTKGFGYLKNALFEVIANCLEHNMVNLILYLLFIVWEFIQMAPFYLATCFQVRNRGSEDSIKMATDILFSFNLNSSIMTPSFLLVAGVTFGFFFLTVLLVGALLHFGSHSSKGKNAVKSYEKMPLLFRCTSAIMMLLSHVLAIPMFIVQLSVFNCVTVKDKSVFASQHGITCWEPIHLAIIIVNCINMIVFLTVLMIFDHLFNETSPKTAIPWACSQANQYKFVKHIAKLTLVVFAVFDPQYQYYHYFAISEIGILGFTIYILVTSPPFVKKIIGDIVVFFEAFFLTLLIESYILYLVNTEITAPVGLIILLSNVAFGVVVLLAIDYHGGYTLSRQVSDTKDEGAKEAYFYELFQLIDQLTGGDPHVAIELYGIYSNHQLSCKSAMCKCRKLFVNHNILAIRGKEAQNLNQTTTKRLITETIQSAMTKVYTGLASMFQINSSRNLDAALKQDSVKGDISIMEKEDLGPSNGSLLVTLCSSMIESEVASNLSSVTLRLISAYFYREYIGNILKSVYDLMYITQKLKPSLRCSFLVYRYRLLIDEEIGEYTKKKSRSGELDVEGIINFENCYEVFRHEAESASYLVNRFWNLLKNKDLDVNGLYDIGSKVGTTYSNIYENYSEALEIFPQSYKLVLELGRFEKYIMNNDALARNYDIQANQINNEQGEYNQGARQSVFGMDISGNTCICVSSGNPESIGNVISINEEITNVLGYKAKEVIGQNCSVVTPPYICVKHDLMIEEFLRRGTSNLLGAHRKISGFNSKGFLVPLETIVTILPSVEDGIKFVAIFRKLENFKDYFDSLRYTCTEADFAIIVTNEEGIILSINENCMTRLGIPPSLTVGKNDNEGFSINQLIKALAEPDMEQELAGEGKKLEMDTGVLLYGSNKENLPHIEAKYCEQNAGKHNVFVKMQRENYGKGIVKVKVYRMFIMPQNTDTMENLAIIEPGYAMSNGDIALSKRATQLIKDKAITEAEKSEPDINDTAGPFTVVKSLNELKQKMNSQGSSFNFVAIKRWVNFVILVVIAVASTQFGFILTDTNKVDNQQRILNVAHLRLANIGLIHSQVFMNVLMAKKSSQAETLDALDIYEYLREYGFRSINILSNSEAYMNIIDYEYTDRLYTLEKKGSVNVETLGMNKQLTLFAHTINTAITQYNSKASGFMSYSFSNLRADLLVANATSTISTEYYFVKENGIRSLANSTELSIIEFKNVMRDRTGILLPYHVGASILVAISLLICFSTILPRLVSIMQEKIDVLMLYTQMNKKEIDAQILKCVEFQKTSGCWMDIEESKHGDLSADGNSESPRNNRRDSNLENEKDSEFQAKTDKETNRKLLEESENPASKEEAKDKDKNKEKDKNKDKAENKNEDEEEDDDEDDSDNPDEKKNEDEMTIQEQLDTEQLKSKLTTNICSLTVLSILVFLVFCSYSTVSTLRYLFSMNSAKNYMEYIYGLSRLINTPLYLSLNTLVSVSENRTIRSSGKDVINTGLTTFLEANAFIQTLKYSSDPILDKTKSYFNNLDSSSMCTELPKMYSLIKSVYTNVNYTNMNKITTSMCNSYYNGILSRGVTQAAFMIHGEINSIQSRRNASNSNISLTEVIKGLNMLQIFLIPAYEGLMLNYMSNLDENYVQELKFIITFYVCYIVFAVMIHCIFWTCLLKSVGEELIKSRGMLKVMPIELIGKLKEMKRGDPKPETRRIISFFSKIQKE